MSIAGRLDRLALPVRRRLSRLTCPRASELGTIGYQQRMRDRIVRWRDPETAHWSAKLSPKLKGIEYVRGLGHAVPETYGLFPSLADVPLDQLPPNVVLKPQHGYSSKGVFLLRDGIEQLTGKTATRDWLLSEAGKKAADPYMAEELLVNFDGRVGAPLDYKFYCFGPRIAYCTVIERNTITGDGDLNRYWYMTPEWKEVPMRLRWDVRPERGIAPAPPFLDAMFAMASDIGRHINVFMRIDLYATTRGPVFGEFTPFPARGREVTPLCDLWMGAMWQGLEGCGNDESPEGRIPRLAAE